MKHHKMNHVLGHKESISKFYKIHINTTLLSVKQNQKSSKQICWKTSPNWTFKKNFFKPFLDKRANTNKKLSFKNDNENPTYQIFLQDWSEENSWS